MIKLKTLIISIVIPNIVGIIGAFLGTSKMGVENLIKPEFSPPAIIFPIVWTILYTLMGFSSYLIFTAKDTNKKNALILYGIQLILNGLWTFFFFRQGWWLFSFFWILLILLVVILMIKSFYKINKTAALLQFPYLIWLVFAGILNFSIYLLN